MSGKELLAALNALLNASSAILLVLAYITIRRGATRARSRVMQETEFVDELSPSRSLRVTDGGAELQPTATLVATEALEYQTAPPVNPNIRRHAQLMLAALGTSAVFLVFYLTSYFMYGDRSSGLEPGLFKTAYLLMLASHVLLAMVMLPMIGLSLWHAYRGNWRKHRRIARPTFWIWLYVSITGVLIYWILYHLIPNMAAASPPAGV